MKAKKLKKELISQFYKNNKANLFMASLFAILAYSLNLLISWILQQLIDTTARIPGALPLDYLTKFAIVSLPFCIAILLFGSFFQPKFIKKALMQYKNFALKKITDKNIASFRDENTAKYLSALTNDISSIEENYLVQIFSIVPNVFLFFGSIAMMLWYSPLMTVIAICFTILPLLSSVFAGNKVEALERNVSNKNKDFTATLYDCLGGFSVIKSFKAEKEILKLFIDSDASLENEKFKKRRLEMLIGVIGALTGMVAQIGVFISSAYLALSGYGVTPGVVIIFVNLMNFIIQPIATFPGQIAAFKASLGLVDKLADELEKNPTSTGNQNLNKLSSKIELNNISFAYDEGKNVLNNISVTFEAGKAYAIVGASGSGKSTMLNLLTSPDLAYEGELYFDSINIKNIRPESLYDVISVINQNVFIFNSSIRDNITMFRKFDENEIQDAINRANLRTLFSEHGDDYLCGENGKNLSGGERQRISIARSLLKKSSVLLADEATSSLDNETSHNIVSEILDIQDVTKIIVTHSLDENLLKKYDEIIVLKDGKINESGKFDELMDRKDYFYALFTVSH